MVKFEANGCCPVVLTPRMRSQEVVERLASVIVRLMTVPAVTTAPDEGETRTIEGGVESRTTSMLSRAVLPARSVALAQTVTEPSAHPAVEMFQSVVNERSPELPFDQVTLAR